MQSVADVSIVEHGLNAAGSVAGFLLILSLNTQGAPTSNNERPQHETTYDNRQSAEGLSWQDRLWFVIACYSWLLFVGLGLSVFDACAHVIG